MDPTALQFSEEALFYFIIPPIIFAAGFTLKKKNFFKNLSYILSFGVLGTVLAMIVLSLIISLANFYFLSQSDRILQSECLILVIE